MTNLAQKLEAILFLSGEPVGLGKLSKIAKEDKDKIKEALFELSEILHPRGIRLSEKNGEYLLVTAPELGKFVQEFMKEELGEDLSRASLEALSVIIYKGPISRSEIDYIRGVGSSYTLRNLMVRGLVERIPDEKDSRVWLYRPSFEFLKYMGIEKLENLPQYDEFRKEIAEFVKRQEAGENNEKEHE